MRTKFGFGFGGTAAHNCIAAYSKDYSLASNLQAKQHMASRSSRVIPANNPPHSGKYSTGVSRYNTMEMQLQSPVSGNPSYRKNGKKKTRQVLT